jgi:hypothetical protein
LSLSIGGCFPIDPPALSDMHDAFHLFEAILVARGAY